MKLVHLSDYASQPDIRIFCSQRWTTPAWRTAENEAEKDALPPEVYLEGGKELYTFNKEKVTCPSCLAKLSLPATPDTERDKPY